MRQIIAAIALLPIVFGGCNTSISSDTAADQSDFTVPSAPTDANTRSDRDILATDGPVDRIADAAISLPLDSEIVDAMSDVLLGDTGSVDASVTRDVSMEDAQPAPESVCPENVRAEGCPFGFTTRSLRDPQLVNTISQTAHATNATLTDLESAQLVNGFNCDGIFPVAAAVEAFELIDAGGVTIYELRTPEAPQTYHWFQFYQGDTEVGFIFQLGIVHPMAIIGDGDISVCSAVNQ